MKISWSALKSQSATSRRPKPRSATTPLVNEQCHGLVAQTKQPPIDSRERFSNLAQRSVELNMVETGFIDRVNKEPCSVVAHAPRIVVATRLGTEGIPQAISANVLGRPKECKATISPQEVDLNSHLRSFTRTGLCEDDHAVLI